MASPHVYYGEAQWPHPACSHTSECNDLELFNEPERIYKPLVQAWWDGFSFVGRCPSCRRWVQFTNHGMEAVDDGQAQRLPQLLPDWHRVAQFA
jgi:hypothetical protein